MFGDGGPPDDETKNEAGSLGEGGALAVMDETESTDLLDATDHQGTLAFDLRFEDGNALLGLYQTVVQPGLQIEKALFSVPDVQFPLDVSKGPDLFRNRRLATRAIEINFEYDILFSTQRLREAGLTLIDSRSRDGGIEFLFSMEGPSSPIRIRARGIFSPAGNSEIALVLHDIIPFGRSPKSRVDVARDLLDALELPGGKNAFGMVRRADCFRWAIGQLLPVYGWKIPKYDDLKLREVICQKNRITLRAWTNDEPDGWVHVKDMDRSPIDEAVGPAVFIDQMDSMAADKSLVDYVDSILDEGEPPAMVVPFAAEILRADPRRQFEGDELVEQALERYPQHLGLLSSFVEEGDASKDTRRERFFRLGRAAESQHESWVAVGAYLSAAKLSEEDESPEHALEAAVHAWRADQTHAEAGLFLCALHQKMNHWSEALHVGKSVLNHLRSPADDSRLSVDLARCALRQGDTKEARRLFRRALRKIENIDGLLGLTDLELDAGRIKVAASLITRLLALDTDERSEAVRCEIQILAGKLAAQKKQMEAALFHWGQARQILPDNVRVACLFARAHQNEGHLNQAIEILRPIAASEPVSLDAIHLMAEIFLERRDEHDIHLARDLLRRLGDSQWTVETKRLDAEASYALGDALPLAEHLFEKALQTESEENKLSSLLKAVSLLGGISEPDFAASLLVAIMTNVVDASSDVLDYLMGKEPQSSEVRAFVRQLSESRVKESRVSKIASGLAQQGRYRDAYDVLKIQDTVESRLERADFAGRAGLYAKELEERRELILLLSEEDEDVASALTRAQYVRTAELHLTDVGEGASAAAHAYAAAAYRGEPVDSQWLQAAVRSGDSRCIFEVLRFQPELLKTIDVNVLRTVSTDPDVILEEQDLTFRIIMKRELSERTRQISDVEDYLNDVRENVDASEAASLYQEMALQHEQPRWLIEASQTYVVMDAGQQGLEVLIHELGGKLGHEPIVAEAAFNLSLTEGTVDEIWLTSNHLLSLLDIDPVFRNSVHRERSQSLMRQHPAEGARALQSWLKDDPGAVEALGLLIPHFLHHQLLSQALSYLEAAVDAGNVAVELEELNARLTDAARRNGDVKQEINALRLQLRFSVNDSGESRIHYLERLLELYGLLSQPQEQIDILNDLVAHSVSEDIKVGFLEKIAALAIDEVHDDEQAITAWKQLIQLDPHHSKAAERLRYTYSENKDWQSLSTELLRAASQASGAEAIALYLRAGDVCYSELNDVRGAIRIWFKALSTSPYSDASRNRLLEQSRLLGSHQLRVRTYIRAMKTLGEGQLAGEMGCEAAAVLAGIMDKPTFAIAVYRAAYRANNSLVEPLYALVELYRSLEQAAGVIETIEELSQHVQGREYAFLLEVKADVIENLKDDIDQASEIRREALRLYPGQRVTALALERYYRSRGEVGKAIDVRRTLADSSSNPEERAQVYSFLAQSAAEELENDHLGQELAAQALALQPKLQHIRMLRIRCLEKLHSHQRIVEEIGVLLDTGILDSTERNVYARRKASVEREIFQDVDASVQTLVSELARAEQDGIGWPTLMFDLVNTQENAGRWRDAYETTIAFLDRCPNGAEHWGNVREIHERLSSLAESFGDSELARGHILEACELGSISRSANLRWARIEEMKKDFASAVTPLRAISLDSQLELEDRIAILGRLGVAEEAANNFDEALEAWRQRAERRPGEAETLCHVERLSKKLDRPEVTRPVAEKLMEAQHGNETEQFTRFLWLARDTLNRDGNPSDALDFYEKARAIFDETGIRREMLECANAAADDTTALAVLERMREEGDILTRDDWNKLAETHALVEQRYTEAFRDLKKACGAAGTLTEREESLMSLICEKDTSLLAEELIASVEVAVGHEAIKENAFLAALYAAVVVSSSLSDKLVIPLAERFPLQPGLVFAASAREKQAEPLRALSRLLKLCEQGLMMTPDDMKSARVQMVDILCYSDIPAEAMFAHLDVVWDEVIDDESARRAILRALRDAEDWTRVSQLFEDVLKRNPNTAREYRLELAYVYREMLEQPDRAIAHLDRLLADDSADREAWGEIFECLEDIGDRQRLADRIDQRLRLVSGLEKRELTRRWSKLMIELGQPLRSLKRLTEARTEMPNDAEMFQMEFDIREAQSPEEFAHFLLREIELQSQFMERAAEALLRLPMDILTADERALARYVRFDRAQHSIMDVIFSIVRSLPANDERAEEIGLFVCRLETSERSEALSAIAERWNVLGAELILNIVDQLRYLSVHDLDSALGLVIPRLRSQTMSPAQARKDFYHFSEHDLLPKGGVLAELFCALKARDREWILSSLSEQTFDRQMIENLGEALKDAASTHWRRQQLKNAKVQLEGLNSHWSTMVFLARMGYHRALERSVSNAEPNHLLMAAQRSIALRCTDERLLALIVLAHSLSQESRENRFRELLEYAREYENERAQWSCLTALGQVAELSPEEKRKRASFSLKLDQVQAVSHCLEAAEIESDPEQKRLMSVQALDLIEAEQGLSEEEERHHLTAIALLAENDTSILNRVLKRSHTNSFYEIEDYCLEKICEHEPSQLKRLSTFRRWAQFRLHDLNDPKEAFEVMLKAHLVFEKSMFAEDAYLLAVEYGMVDEQCAVVADPLAQAGLLAYQKKYHAARDVLKEADAGLADAIPAQILLADVCYAAGLLNEGDDALLALTQNAHAGPEVWRQLFESKREQAAYKSALDLLLEGIAKFGEQLYLHGSFLQCFNAAPIAHQIRVLERLAHLHRVSRFTFDKVPPEEQIEWLDAAIRVHVPSAFLILGKTIAERDDTSQSWGQYLSLVAHHDSSEGLWNALKTVGEREDVIPTLRQDAPEAFSESFALALEKGDLDIVIPLLLKENDRAPLDWALRQQLSIALEKSGRVREAAELLDDSSALDPFLRGQHLLRMAGLWARAGEYERSLENMMELPFSDFDGEAKRITQLLVNQIGSVALLIQIRMTTAFGYKDGDVDDVFALIADDIDPGLALSVARWRMEKEPRDERAWSLVSRFGSKRQRSFFDEQFALFGSFDWPVSLSEHARAVRDFRYGESGLVPEQKPPMMRLERARWGTAQEKTEAWESFALESREAGRLEESARYMARSGVVLHDQPIEIRLAADPALANFEKRAEAVVQELIDADSRSEGPTTELGQTFHELNEQGWVGAAHRVQVSSLKFASTVKPKLVDYLNVSVDVSIASEIRKTSRTADGAHRTTLAALAMQQGHEEWAAFLNPALQSRLFKSEPQAYAVQLRAEAREAARKNQPQDALHLYRATIPALGTDTKIEGEMQRLGAVSENWILTAESMVREIRLQSDQTVRLTRVQSLIDVLENKLGDTTTALRVCREASKGLPKNVWLGDNWLRLAEAKQNHRQVIRALRYLDSFEEDVTRRYDRLSRCSKIYRFDLKLPKEALEIVTDAVEELGSSPILKMEMVLCLAALGRQEEAGNQCMELLDTLDPAHPFRHEIRRDAARYFLSCGDLVLPADLLLMSAREGDLESIELALGIAKEAEDWERIDHLYRFWLKYAPERGSVREATREYAEFYDKTMDNPAEAIRLLENHVLEDSQSYENLMLLASFYLREKRVLDAGLAYERASQIDGLEPHQRGAALREAACLLAGLGELERAAPLAEGAIAEGSTDMMLLTILSGWYRSQEDYEKLDRILGHEADLLDKIQDATYPWMERAILRRDFLRDEVGAREALFRILDIKPDHQKALDALERDAERSGDYKGLVAALEEAIAFSEDPVFANSSRIQLAQLKADVFSEYNEALNVLNEIPEDFQLPLVLVHAGNYALRSNQEERALQYAKRVANEPGVVMPGQLLLLIARNAMDEGDFDGVVHCVKSCLAQKEFEDEADHLLMTMVEHLPSTYDTSALLAVIGALGERLDPKLEGDKAGRRFCIAAQLEMERGDPSEASKWAAKAVAADPNLVDGLRLAAEAFEKTQRYIEAELYLRRLGSLCGDSERIEILQRRAGLFEKAGRKKEALRVYLHALDETDSSEVRTKAIEIAMTLGARDVLSRLGVLQQDEKEGLVDQELESIRDFVIAGQYLQAIEMTRSHFRKGGGNTEIALQGILASRGASKYEDLLYFIDRRVKNADDAQEVEDLYREAGRVARDNLGDAEKAVKYMYQAHQLAPDDIELQIDVADLYTKVPHLHTHAQIGLEQLSQQIPEDHRLYVIASRLAEAAGHHERSMAMLDAGNMLSGINLTSIDETPELESSVFDHETSLESANMVHALAGRTKLPQWHLLLENLGGVLESRLIRHDIEKSVRHPLETIGERVSSMGTSLLNKVVGRPIELWVGDQAETLFEPGAVTQVILPERIFNEPVGIVSAFMARAVFAARSGFVLSETLAEDDIADFLEHLRFLLREPGRYDQSALAEAGLSQELTQELIVDAQAAVARNIVKRWQRMAKKTTDRFAFVASGSIRGAIMSGPYPDALDEAPLLVAAGLKNHNRALDLCGYSLSNAGWDLRVKWGFGFTP